MNININNPLKAANDDKVTCQLRFPGQYEDNNQGSFIIGSDIMIHKQPNILAQIR